MLFLNTRPTDRALNLTQALQSKQIEVLELPLLELHPTPWSQALMQLYAQLITAQVIVVVSPSAVHYGMTGLKQAGLFIEDLSHVQWIAVGAATAHALAQYGVQSHVPEVETSEGMLALPILNQWHTPTCMAFWRGEGGRQFMMESLQAKGVQVLNFVLYRRQCPEQASKILTKNLLRLQQAGRYCMLVTSEASWINWLTLISNHPDVLNRAHFLVLGERLAQLLARYQQTYSYTFSYFQLQDLRMESILKQIDVVQGTP